MPSARLAYSFLFFLAILISWAGRDLAKPLIEKIPCETRSGGRGRLSSTAAAASQRT